MTTTTINQNEKKYWKLIEDLGDPTACAVADPAVTLPDLS